MLRGFIDASVLSAWASWFVVAALLAADGNWGPMAALFTGTWVGMHFGEKE